MKYRKKVRKKVGTNSAIVKHSAGFQLREAGRVIKAETRSIKFLCIAIAIPFSVNHSLRIQKYNKIAF